MGLSGIAITDHECLSAHMEVNMYAKKLRETNPDFTVALGNEVYLTDDREKGQKYYHFLLVAKDAKGHEALRKLSSIAWYNSYHDRGMERVPILKSEMSKVMEKYKGHVIATSACIGGELSTLAYAMHNAESVGDEATATVHYNQIVSFMKYCLDTFGSDFYIECAPSTADDQIAVNRKLYRIAKAYNLKMVVGTDAHYLTVNDRAVHKAYLNSKGGEREVDSFYEFARLMDVEEVEYLLDKAFGDSEVIDWILKNTLELQSSISFFSLEKTQQIPSIKVPEHPKNAFDLEYDLPNIKHLLTSDNLQERYWINECLLALREKKLWNEDYLSRIETEADVLRHISTQLNDCLFAYFNTFKHYIDLFWECGSIVGPGRGSATGFLSNYLLGITQLDPIRWELPYWRFLNKERAELPSLLLILGSCKKRTLTIA